MELEKEWEDKSNTNKELQKREREIKKKNKKQLWVVMWDEERLFGSKI